MLSNMLRQDILIMCGVLIAAWFVKVVGVFVYLTYSRRCADSRAAAAARNPSRPQARSKAPGTPAHVIAALPVMIYNELPSSSLTCSCCEPQQQPDTLVATAGMLWQQQQQQHDTILPWRRSTDVLPSQQDQQQQQRQQRFSLRLSFDSAIGKKQLPLTNQLPLAAAPATAATAATEPAEADACAICFCEYEAVSWVKKLPCGHFYHTQCIDTWLAKGTTCPLCKRPVWEEEEQVVEGDQAAAETAAAAAAPAAGAGSEQRQEGLGTEQQQEAVAVVVLDSNEGAAAANPSAALAETGAPAVVLGTPVEAQPAAAAAAASAAGCSAGEAGGHVIDIQHVAAACSSRAHAQQ